MRSRIAGAVVIMAGMSLAGCGTTSGNFSDWLKPANTTPEASTSTDAPSASMSADGSAATQAQASASSAEAPPPLGVPVEAQQALLGGDPNDDLSLGKKQYRAKNFGQAEKHFRRAVEMHPRDAEAWLGLAASYDRLRRFDLADRAYKQAIGITGPTVEILNNEGYSYMLRGDYRRARATLLTAQRKDPANKYVHNNLVLLESSHREGKAVE